MKAFVSDGVHILMWYHMYTNPVSFRLIDKTSCGLCLGGCHWRYTEVTLSRNHLYFRFV